MRLPFKFWLNVTMGFAVVAGSMAAAGAVLAASESVQADSDSLRREIDRLKNEKEYEAKRVEEMRQEREQFVKEIRRMESLNAKYTKEINDVKAQLADRERLFEERLKKMEANLQETKETRKKIEPPVQVENQVSYRDVERKAAEVLQKGGDLDPEDEKFREELARAHYNMGNVYFERGEHQRAVVEYYQAVDLMPYDADAHYNLAFVSGDYLGDQETALKHYQWYLYLKPNASDKKLVEAKIVSAKLHERGKISSKVDNTELSGHTNIGR